MPHTKRDIHGNQVSLTSAEEAIEDAKETAHTAQKAIDDAITDEDRIEACIEADYILKVMFDELVELSNNTRTSLLVKMKTHKNQ